MVQRGRKCGMVVEGFGAALRPKLYRNDECLKGLLLLEEERRVAFRRCGTQLITERLPLDRWEWCFLMQHYGARTRLLDWSDGALVALYFAVVSRGGKSDKYGTVDAVVYMIEAFPDCRPLRGRKARD